jgi:aerobic carbon-monoxide dehydrogenase large subunit
LDLSTLRAHADGTFTLSSGTFSVGQGLDTALSSIVATRLGVALDKVLYLQGDTDLLEDGRGNGGSSALISAGSAVHQAVDDLVQKAREMASGQLEVAAEDLHFVDGAFRVTGTDLSITLADLARVANAEPGHQGEGIFAASRFSEERGTFPNGCHICEVEVDRETGAVEVVSYTAVEDVGRVLNPMLVDGQLHGGIVQGIGQALLEEIRHDETGQLITGSFMDYAMPRASDVPSIVTASLETPTALNPLGVKGVGEAGTVGALSATTNAVCNALLAVGIRHLDMPATPMRVWQALRDATGGTANVQR